LERKINEREIGRVAAVVAAVSRRTIPALNLWSEKSMSVKSAALRPWSQPSAGVRSRR
jgi:hypothetical protein